MILARLEIVVPYGGVGVYTPDATFRLPDGEYVEKLTIIARDTDAVVQVREGDSDAPFPIDVQTTEQKIDRGFQSFVFPSPITGFRFRGYVVGQTTRISFTAYG